MIQKVGIIGAGAIGAYFIWGLENHCDILAKENRYERLKNEGIYINDVHYDLHVASIEEKHAYDLLLICTKYDGLKEVLPYLPSLIHENTIVLSLLNGVDSEELVGQVIPKYHIVHSLMRIASKREMNRIYFDPKIISDVYYGSIYDNQWMVEELNAFFSHTKIKYHALDNILEDQWLKYASNISNNLPQAILGIPHILYDSEHGKFLSHALWSEVYKVACAKGISIPEKPTMFTDVPKSSKWSTLQDIEAKRRTEVDMFLGVLIQMARENNIDVPYSEFAYHLIKSIELKNEGYFDL